VHAIVGSSASCDDPLCLQYGGHDTENLLGAMTIEGAKIRPEMWTHCHGNLDDCGEVGLEKGTPFFHRLSKSRQKRLVLLDLISTLLLKPWMGIHISGQRFTYTCRLRGRQLDLQGDLTTVGELLNRQAVVSDSYGHVLPRLVMLARPAFDRSGLRVAMLVADGEYCTKAQQKGKEQVRAVRVYHWKAVAGVDGLCCATRCRVWSGESVKMFNGGCSK